MIAARWKCDLCGEHSPANQKYTLRAWAHIVFGCWMKELEGLKRGSIERLPGPEPAWKVPL